MGLSTADGSRQKSRHDKSAPMNIHCLDPSIDTKKRPFPNKEAYFQMLRGLTLKFLSNETGVVGATPMFIGLKSILIIAPVL